MKMLITPTLLNAWTFFLNAGEDWEEKAREDFLATLRKEPFLPTPAIQAGIDFERDVMKVALGGELDEEDESYNACVCEVAGIVRHGQWQVKVQKNIMVSGEEILLYGKVDVLKGPFCYDIKFTGKYEAPKYQASAQHLLYIECLETVPVFQYLVSDGKAVYVEEYRKDSIPLVDPMVSDFLSWMGANPTYGEIFRDKWKAKY